MVTMSLDLPTVGEDDDVRCVSSDGWGVVEVITRSCAGAGRCGKLIRIRRGRDAQSPTPGLADLLAFHAFPFISIIHCPPRQPRRT
jgi:hypothetical protein